MSRALALFPVLVLLAFALAGCVGSDEAPAPPEVQDPDDCVTEALCGAEAVVDQTGRDLRTQLTAADELPAPTWKVGDVFEQHLYYGSADTSGEHIQTMVVDTSGDCYTFGTTSQLAARTEAVFDMPILGCIGKANLETSGFGPSWDWMYSFPLTDGKTWSGAVDWIFNWNDNSFRSYEFTLTAAYSAAIDTPMGDFPGFEITGTTADGEVLLEYNYVPAVGWFSHFWMYDLATDDADDIMFHAMSMGRSTGYTGSYYIDTAETAIEGFFLPPFSVMENEEPQHTFSVPAGATYLKGVVVPLACPGVSKVLLVGPDNQAQQFDHQYDGDPQACGAQDENAPPNPAMYTVNWFDAPAKAGDWRIGAVGAGVFGYFIWLEAVTEVSYELAAGNATA